MKTITLKRSGKTDVRFEGESVAYYTTQRHHGDAQNRFTEYEIYKKEDDSFVLHMEYTSYWQGEAGTSDVVVLKNEEELKDYFLEEDNNISDAGKSLLEDVGIEVYEEI